MADIMERGRKTAYATHRCVECKSLIRFYPEDTEDNGRYTFCRCPVCGIHIMERDLKAVTLK